MVTRYEFLKKLHDLIQPEMYLEIGVQFGHSLVLAEHSREIVGIDPNPLLAYPMPPNATIYNMTSSEYHAQQLWLTHSPVDMAFIDGSHLFEDAVDDYDLVLQKITPYTVVVFDDVLPRNQGEASRVQCPGDWTGDVWRLHTYLSNRHAGQTKFILVDTFPTGVMVALDVKWSHEPHAYNYLRDEPVPEDVLKRTNALSPELAYDYIKNWWDET